MSRRRLLLTAWSLATVVAIAAPNAFAANISITGPEQTVYDWSQMACFPTQYSDGAVRAFRDSQNRIQLILAADPDNTRMVGADFNTLVRDCTVIRGSPNDPFAGNYNNAQWLMATQTSNGNDVYGLVHNEYHVNTNTALCPSGKSVDCQHASVSLVTSTNGGASYTSTTPPSQYVDRTRAR